MTEPNTEGPTAAATAAVLSDYLTESQLGTEIGKSERQIQRMRARREGPPYITIGRTIMYRHAAVREWLLSIERPGGLIRNARRRGRAA